MDASVVELAQRLIQQNTVNPPGNEYLATDVIRDFLQRHGIPYEVKARKDSRPNIIARIKGQGQAPPLLLYGHVDVVGVKDQIWQHDPFSGIVKDDFLWGRGALDMKSGVAMLTEAFTRFGPDNKPPGDLILAVVSDEEAGGEYGAGFLIEQHASQFDDVKHAIGEFGGFTLDVLGRSFMPIQVAEKRTATLKATFHGLGGHSALDLSDTSIIRRAGEFIAQIEKYRMPVKLEHSAQLMISDMVAQLGVKGSILKGLLNPLTAPLCLRVGGRRLSTVFEPLIRSTVRVTGVQTPQMTSNVVPSKVSITINARLLPTDDGSHLLAYMKKLGGESLTIEGDIPATGPGEFDSSQLHLIRQVVSEHDKDISVIPMLLPGSTDARYFSKIGIQTYGFLPTILPRDFRFMSLIHAENERCPVNSLVAGADLLSSFIQGYRGQ